MNRDELIDFLLGELPEEQASAVTERVALDESAAQDLARYEDALGILREAAAGADWNPAAGSTTAGSTAAGSTAAGSTAAGSTAAGSGRLYRIGMRVGIAAAAVLLVAVGLFWANRNGVVPSRVFEPGTSYGALLPEELGADGAATPKATGSGYVLRQGSVAISSLGAQATHDLTPGAEILENSEITCAAEGGARITLPHGGQLYLRPLSTIQLRPRRDGRVALRLLSGDVATVADAEPIHISVEGTDLLLTHTVGAALLRHKPGEAICLRGRLDLHVEDGSLWRVPEGQRLPASCARAPESAPATSGDLQLDWYFALQYGDASSRDIEWEREGLSKPFTATSKTLLYLRIDPTREGKFELRLAGGATHQYPVARGRTLELRIPIRSLGSNASGKGDQLEVSPASFVKQARLFTPAR